MNAVTVRVGLQQRVLPAYRSLLFDALGAALPGGLGVFAGNANGLESIEAAERLETAHLTRAENLHLFPGQFYLCYQRGLVDWLRAWDPQVLIVEANPRYLSTPAALTWMRSHRRPVIGWGLGAPAAAGLWGGLRSASRRSFLHQFDALITYSRTGAEEYQAAGFPAERIFVAPNAAAARPRHLPPVRPPRIDPHHATLLFVGRLQTRKRVDVLLRACAALPVEERPHLWVVGDGPARSELERLACQVYPAAVFLGARRGPDLERLFCSADLFVLPGTGGLAIQQAMSFALPVIVGEADGTQSDLVRPENGWQISPGDPAALAQTLAFALADIPRLRRMGRESFRITCEEINLENMVDIFLQAIRSVSV